MFRWPHHRLRVVPEAYLTWLGEGKCPLKAEASWQRSSWLWPMKSRVWSFKYKQVDVKNFIKRWELAKEEPAVTNEIQWNNTVFPHFSSSEAGWLERKAESMVLQTDHRNFMICKMQQATEVCKTTLSKWLLDISAHKLNAQVNWALHKYLREFREPVDGRDAPSMDLKRCSLLTWQPNPSHYMIPQFLQWQTQQNMVQHEDSNIWFS